MNAAIGLIFATLFIVFMAEPALSKEQRAGAATHPSLVEANLPPLVPIETFFSNRTESWGHRVSPDGKRLLWIALHEGKPAVHFRKLDAEDFKVLPAERPVRWAYWAADSRHITGWWDNDGDENYHILLADTQAPDAPFRDRTPFKGVKVGFHQWFPDEPLVYLLRDNRRDRAVFDLYRYDLAKDTRELVMENPGDVAGYETDDAGKVIGIRRTLPNSDWVFQVPDDDGWRTIKEGAPEDQFWISGKPPAGQSWAYGVSNIGRDKQAVVKIDLNTGAEEIIYQDPEADVQDIWVDSKTYKLLAAWSEPDYPKIKTFAPELQDVLDRLKSDGPVKINVPSHSDDWSVMTIQITRDRTGATFHLYDRRTDKITPLAAPRIAQQADTLSPMKHVQFPASDGLTLNGYLTIPTGTDGKNLPMVLAVHGGPFWRDSWGYYGYDQMMANRGYAVLRVNYRGSTGYGRTFVAKSRKEIGGAMVSGTRPSLR